MKHSLTEVSTPISTALVAVMVIGLATSGCSGSGGTKQTETMALSPAQASSPVPAASPLPNMPVPAAPPPPDIPVPAAPPLPDVAEQPLLASPPSGQSNAQLQAFYSDYFTRSEEGSYSSVEFDLINLPRAYVNLYNARGAAAAARPGNGVTIGFIDSGLDTQHPAFNGKSVAVEYFGGTSAGSDLDGGSHGTSVASIAAGVPRNLVSRDSGRSANIEGIAPGANIRMLAVPLDSPPPDYQIAAPRPSDLQSLPLDISFRAALEPNRGIDILNLSIGIDANIEDYSEQVLRTALSAADIAVLTQAGRNDKTLLVWAAGNEYNADCVAGTPSCVNGTFDASSPSLTAGLMARISELRPHSVAVVAVSLGGEIADFSNRCGIAANWCIAAPGENIGIAVSERAADGSIQRLSEYGQDTSGTSYAAPMVSGGLALMKQQFRNQLSNTELLSRMLATADKTGIYADRDTYGQGLLDLGAATAPVGGPVVAMSAGFVGAGNGQFAPLSLTKMYTGAAFGDALVHAFAGQEIAAFDALGAPFWYPLGGLGLDLGLQTDKPQRQLFELMDGLNDAPAAVPLTPTMQFSMHSGSLAHSSALMPATGLLSLVDAPMSVQIKTPHLTALVFTSAQHTTAPVPHTRGLAIAYHLPHTPLRLRLAYMAESSSAIGTTASGAFDDLSAASFFAGAGLAYNLGAWRLSADAELGVSYADNETGLIEEISAITTSAFSLGLDRKLGLDTDIRFSLQAPVRVERGRMHLQLPAGRTASGRIVHSRLDADLEPSGRQVDARVQLTQQIARGKMSLAAVASHQPGHDKNAASRLSLFASYRLDF